MEAFRGNVAIIKIILNELEVKNIRKVYFGVLPPEFFIDWSPFSAAAVIFLGVVAKF